MYIWYFWQGNHHTYGHIRCVCTVLANPNYNATTRLCSLLVCLHYAFAFCQCTCWQAYVHAPTACVLALHSVLSVHVLAGLCVRTHCLRACITQCFVCICAGRLVHTHPLLACLHYIVFCQYMCWQAYVYAPTACVLALHSVLSVYVLAGLCVRTHCFI